MGCGISSLTGDSFDGINANKARKVDFHGEPSMYRHDNIYSSSRPAASSDPTKGPYVQTHREEPLRDTALPTTSDGHYRKPSYHGKGAYRDLTLSSDEHYRKPSYHGKGAYQDLTLSSDEQYRKPSYHGKGAYRDLTFSSDDDLPALHTRLRKREADKSECS